MLDVHAPHESIHSWKSFFIHIATIVIGLLIAVGLEQTVEYFHHKRQVAETRGALLTERKINIGKFGLMTEEFHRVIPKLQTNLEVYKFLRLYPGAPREKWPGRVSWIGPTFGYIDSAWKTAQNSNSLNYMPQPEVRQAANLYLRLQSIQESFDSMRQAREEAMTVVIEEPDPARLTPAQIEHQIGLTSKVIMRYIVAATAMMSLSRHHPDFQPSPSRTELFDLLRFPNDPDEMAKVNVLLDRNDRIEREFGGEVDARRPATSATDSSNSTASK